MVIKVISIRFWQKNMQSIKHMWFRPQLVPNTTIDFVYFHKIINISFAAIKYRIFHVILLFVFREVLGKMYIIILIENKMYLTFLILQ